MTTPPAIERPATRAWSIAILLVLCAIAFARVVTFELVWDDKNLIADNPFLRQTDTLWRAFSHGFWELTAVDHESAFYRPLVVVAYWIEWRVFGGSPAGFHAISLLLHVTNVLLLLRIATRLRLPTVAAAIAAAIFAIHPVQITAVANVASQTDLLATLLILAGCLLWSSDRRRRWAALPLLFLALLAKESAIVGPVLAISCASAVRHVSGETTESTARSLVTRIAAFVPLLVVVPYAILRLLALDGAIGTAEHGLSSLGGTQYAHYVGRLLMPLPVPPIVPRPAPGLPFVLGSLAVLLGAAVLVLQPRRDARVRFAGGWFLLALFPVAEILPLGARQNDLLLYLPLAGAALLIGHFVGSLRNAIIAASIAIAVCGVVTVVRVGVWKSSLSLWRYSALLDPDDPATRMNYAIALREAGDPEGCVQLAATLDLLPARPSTDVEVRTTYNLGNCERSAGRLSAAAALYQRAFDRSGGTLRAAGHNLAITWMELHRNDEALALATRLLALDDHVASSWHLLGVIHARGSRFDEAAAALEKALQLDPGHRASRDLLGKLRAERGGQ